MYKLLILGDSNTWGWDPADFMGGPYERPWPYYLKKAGHTVVVDAMPGREIPHTPQLLELTMKSIRREHADLLLVMLGSNDILNMYQPDAGPALRRMTRLVEMIRKEADADLQILLMGIPRICVPGDYAEAGEAYNLGLEQIAREHGCLFLPADAHLPLACDGVHLTEEGHRRVGEKAVEFVSGIENEV